MSLDKKAATDRVRKCAVVCPLRLYLARERPRHRLRKSLGYPRGPSAPLGFEAYAWSSPVAA